MRARVTRAAPQVTPAPADRLLAQMAAVHGACAAALEESRAADRVAPNRPSATAFEWTWHPGEESGPVPPRLRQYSKSEAAAAAALAALPHDGPARALAVREDLLRGALDALHRLPQLAVAPAVKARLCEVFRGFCDRPRADDDPRFRPDLSFHGCALAACATLTRFPAGQLDWQVSGLPRSYLLRMPARDLPRVLRTVLLGLRGFKPCYVAHMGVRRYPLLFVEAESHRSYHRMAQSMALQPEVRGLLMEAWFHSPETVRVSPHLSWTNRTPLANGATLTDLGPAPAHSGFLTGSPERQRLYERGEYRPTVGFVIWPRPALLAWAAAHPEFGVEADTG